jgi:hypothetical protein
MTIDASAARAAQVAVEAQKQIARQMTAESLPRYAYQGAAAGAGLTGIALLLKAFKNSTDQPSTSYTTPVEAAVYRPDRPAKRRRRKLATTPVSVSDGLLPETAQAIASKNTLGTTSVALALGLGIPAGMMGASKLTGYLRQVARDRELRDAQAEFERSLQDYAESGDEKLRTAKRAAMSDREVLLARLAANCTKLASMTKTATAADAMKDYLTAWAVLTPLLGGVYGFQNRWSKRDGKDLQLAERQVNLKREATSPTFTVATLKSPPHADRLPEDEEERQRIAEEQRSSIADAVGNYDTDYL